MKSLKFFLICTVLAVSCISASAQLQQLRTTSGKLVKYGRVATLSTTDSALNIIDTFAVTNNTAGMIEVGVVGQDSVGSGVTGKQIYRYKKVAGTLTLSAATQIMAIVTDTPLGTSTYTFTATDSNNLQLKVKGKLGVTVAWRILIVPL